MLKNKIMKIAPKSFAKMKQYVRNVSVHNKQRGKHGKAFERFLSDYFCFPAYEQNNAKVDFPVEVVSQGGVPSQLIGDWEVKYYDIKRQNILLGDIKRKVDSFKKGLILVVGFYDGSPENLVEVKFYKIRTNVEILKMRKIWLQVDEYIKDKSNPINKTREMCSNLNRVHNGAFSVTNLSRDSRWSNSKQKWQNEARQTSLSLNLKKLTPMF